ncbi:hypothetical protein B0H15DRAFT_855026 [Mycena belliarum]|uniref:RRM domain-containing protein n=1 Tax=Mycena belliarum TaxID=1033014 RepID=A0AAD6XQX8_9AGAR|nr:hypothetical protein B0H15DRAFT_855026 [Mycena belliae]
MATHSVHVSGIAPTTTQAHLHDFFTFCGTIDAIDFKAEGGSATIHFQKSSAAKTALMLNGGTLDAATLSVTSDTAHEDEEHTGTGADAAHHIEQSDKPRAGIAAEYLAKGYVLSDSILNRAIEIDTKQGISKRFLSYLTTLDSTIGAKALGPDKTVSGKVVETVGAATQQARAVDEQKGYSKSAGDYYSRALASPLGGRVRAFYTTTSKQALDIHEEARRIAAEHKAAAASAAPAAPVAAPAAAVETKEKETPVEKA